MSQNYGEILQAMQTEAALVVGALLALGIDLTLGRRWSDPKRLRIAVSVGLVALAGAVHFSFAAGIEGPVFGGVFVLDTLALATRIGVLVLAAFTLALLPGVARLRHPAEFVAILLFATTGFSLMAVSGQLLIAFLALELASLSLYVLAGFDKTRPASAEAALKYFLFGGISAAFLLFGFSLLYGLTGSIDFREIAQQLRLQPLTPLLLIALVMVLVAFGFKAAAAPFHLWAPDVYQGAPASSAALIASASKLAGFVLFVRLLWSGLEPAAGSVTTFDAAPGFLPVLALISAASLVLGNVGALAQRSVRRLLAYSAIAHAGALLLGVIAARLAGPGPLFYYAATYGLATVGAFGVIAVVERNGRCDDLADLAGLHRRSPFLAACLLVFILSLAGIPPLAGFFGKFAVFAAALQLGGLGGTVGWLVIAAIGFSAVALYYYLLILKQALVALPGPHATPIRVPRGAAVTLLLCALLLFVLGLFPSLLLGLVG
ncbi:MAG TPA: NADH-quinone oxidoreductase subunit N [Opitutaceae bacterium]|nr:NADH-quinone oxidoreductase subunit N [Opitutaceae bacterium]